MRFFVLLFPLILATAAHAIESPCRTVKKETHLVLRECGALNILTLSGTPEERARLHGTLVGRELSSAPFDYFADAALEPLIESPWKHWFAELALNLWVRWADRQAPASYFAELEAYAEGSNLPLIRVRRALLTPDIALSAWALLENPIFGGPVLGCTSAARSWADGRFVYGRNLDFFGVGPFDEHPLMVVNLPPAGGPELKHLVFGADGLPFAGITGFNEAGIGFAVHQNYTRDSSAGGIPMPYIGELVLRQARSLDQAVELLKNLRPGPLWTFILIDVNRGEVRAVESSKKHFEVRRMDDGVFGQTNHSLHESVRADELIDPGTLSNSISRMEKARDLLQKSAESPLNAVGSVLGQGDDPRGFLSIHADIMKPLTIQSVILEKEKDGAIFVSLSRDPAPTASGTFVRFRPDDLWASLSETDLAATIVDPSRTPLEIRKNQIDVAQAFAASARPHGAKAALQKLKGQNSAEALYARAVLSLENDDPREALERLAEFNREPTLPTLARSVREGAWATELAALWRANRRDEARRRAASVLAMGPLDPQVERLTKDLVEGRSPLSDHLKLSYDFFSGALANLPLKPEAWKKLDARVFNQPIGPVKSNP